MTYKASLFLFLLSFLSNCPGFECFKRVPRRIPLESRLPVPPVRFRFVRTRGDGNQSFSGQASSVCVNQLMVPVNWVEFRKNPSIPVVHLLFGGV